MDKPTKSWTVNTNETPVLSRISKDCWLRPTVNILPSFSLCYLKSYFCIKGKPNILQNVTNICQMTTNTHHTKTTRAFSVCLWSSFQIECRLIALFKADKLYQCESILIEDLYVLQILGSLFRNWMPLPLIKPRNIFSSLKSSLTRN